MQRKAARIATEELSDYLGVPVRIGNVDLELFNRLALKDVYLEDQEGKVLFEASTVAASFEMLPLLKGKFVFTTVRLFGFSLNLRKPTADSPLNLQFVIDAFASKDTLKKEQNFDLRFNSILIQRGKFSFHVEDAETTPERFNAKHIDIKDISASIALKALNKDSLNAQIKKLGFNESSGFSLNKLALNAIGNRDSISIKGFKIELPQTSLNISLAKIELTEVDSLPNLLNDAPIELTIASSRIYPRDLSVFVPAFQNFTDALELSAEANGRINDFNLERLTLKYSEKMLFIGQMVLKDITRPQETHVYGEVSKMYLTTDGMNSLANNFSEQPINLPEPLLRLGTINFTGQILGYMDNLTATGKLASNIGSIQTDLRLGRDKENGIEGYTQGHITSGHLQLGELFDNKIPLGGALFDIELSVEKPVMGNLHGNVNAKVKEFDYKSYTYKDIVLSGDFQKNGFNGILQMNDPNGYFFAQGILQSEGKNSLFNFTSQLEHFRPDKLNLTDKYESPDISLTLNADFTGNSIDNMEGNIRLENLRFHTAPRNFDLDQLVIEASGHSLDRQITLSSDILNGEVTGAFSFNTLVSDLMNTFKAYVPAVIPAKQKKQDIHENNFALLLTIENTEDMSNTMKLPFTMLQSGRITGHYNNIYNKFRIEAWLPRFNAGGSMFESGYLVCDNPEDRVNLRLKANQYNKNGLRNYLDLKAEAQENLVNTVISWANNKEQLFKADIFASTRFSEVENEQGGKPTLRTEVTLNKSDLTIKDTLWTLNPAVIAIQDGKIDIQHFRVDRENQFLTIDGSISKDPADSLLVKLNDVELGYVFDVLDIPILQFAGRATGDIYAIDLLTSRMLNTNLSIQNFAFNQVTLGDLKLFSEWDNEQQGIYMQGTVYTNDSTWTDVNGYIFPVGVDAGLSLYFDAKDVNVAFIQPFVEGLVKDLRGQGFGKVHLHGTFSDITAEGDIYVEDGGVGVDFLNTYYTFTDSVHLDYNSINLRNVTIHDKLGNPATLSLKFNHNYFHNDYNFLVNLQGNNFLVYDVDQKKNPMIYGTVFANGTAEVSGNSKLVDFDVNVQSAPNTKVYMDFMTTNMTNDYDFITFVDKNKLATATDSIAELPLATDPSEESAELRMNFMLDLTPDATLEVLMDPIAGDRIQGTANGSLQIMYGSNTDLRMYGDVNIVEGNYNFSLQQIIHKDFEIRDGSTVTFRGDPFNANMNIDAIYNLTANIGDLDESLLNESSRTSVPVNCVLKLDGALRGPSVSFDLEFPSSNEELERQVKAFLDTEDMMTRQIIYLLVLNKFYTPEYATTSYQSSELNSVASGAISAQLSSILNSITDKVQIGTNIRAAQDGFTENTEYEMLLSSQLLDNRLLINGNFGMRNTINTGNTNTFIGEFDLEYKLTKSGDIRLKAYNHARDTYFGLKQALTIQGVGVSFQKDFTNLSDIFHRRRSLTPLPAAQDSTILTPTAIPDSTQVVLQP